jgi:hypothetical protein
MDSGMRVQLVYEKTWEASWDDVAHSGGSGAATLSEERRIPAFQQLLES